MFLKRLSAFIAVGPLAAAGFLAATAGSASAGIGAPVGTLSQAGYQATGRDYRYAQATITVPDIPSVSGQTQPETDTCTIGAAPSFTVDVTKAGSGVLAVYDETTGHFLTSSVDYTVSPAFSATVPETYVVTLIDSGNYAAGDTLDVRYIFGGGTIVIEGTGGKDAYTVPTETCYLSHHLDSADPVTVTDTTKTSTTLTGGTDYKDIPNYGTSVTLLDSGAWDYGDSLSIAYTAYKAYNYSPAEYIELGSTTGFARIGITDDHDGSWELFAATGHTSLYGQHVEFAPLTGVAPGDGVTVSVYYNVSGNELFFTATDPNPSNTVLWAATAGAHGQIYTSAAALDDWDFTSNGVASALPPWVNPFTINHFYGIALTTESGARGSMVGPWTTSSVSATSNGLLPPSGTTRVAPTPLGSDGYKANGAVRADDSFALDAVG